MAKISQTVQSLLILLIQCYRYLVSPLLRCSCRFYPSCSLYAVEAIELHGILRGVWLIVKRVMRCQPWCQGGVDTVSPHSRREAQSQYKKGYKL